MAIRSNLSNLIADAFAHREGEATASDRNWKATRMGNYVGVEHHATHMFNVTRDHVVEPVDPGWGGQSDTAGVRKITSGFGCVGTDCGVAHKELFYDTPETRGGYRRLEGSQWRNAIQRDPELRVSPPSRSVEMSLPSRVRTSPRPDRLIHPTRQDQEGNYGSLDYLRHGDTTGGPTPEGARWEAHTPSGLAADEFTYQDENTRGPDYSQEDPFDFSDPEEARQAQAITDMEETLSGLDERSSRPRNEG